MNENKKLIAIIKELDSFEYEFYFNDMIENLDLIIDGGRDYNSYNTKLLNKIKLVKDDYNLYRFEGFNNKIEYFNYYLKKENNTSWNDQEVNTFENNFKYCDILKIITNKNYNYTFLSGYSQGERIKVFYNIDEVKSDDLKLLEVLFFGGCLEVVYTSETDDPNDIYNYYYSNILLYEYNKEEIIKTLKNITKIENIKLYEQKEKQVIKYYFEEI